MEKGMKEDLYTKETITIDNTKLEVYKHNNGILFVPNTENNCRAVSSITTKSIQSVYTILEEKEEEPATSTYTKYLYLLKKRAPSARRTNKK